MVFSKMAANACTKKYCACDILLITGCTTFKFSMVALLVFQIIRLIQGKNPYPPKTIKMADLRHPS